jgi:hypothetical protein
VWGEIWRFLKNDGYIRDLVVVCCLILASKYRLGIVFRGPVVVALIDIDPRYTHIASFFTS